MPEEKEPHEDLARNETTYERGTMSELMEKGVRRCLDVALDEYAKQLSGERNVKPFTANVEIVTNDGFQMEISVRIVPPRAL